MGRLQAEALAADDFIPLENQLRWHLTANHYPPVPDSMITTCIEAIDLANEGEWESYVKLPEGVEWRRQTMSPVWAIVEGHHLEPWIIESELD